jgi:hypothetical protein
MQTLSWHLPGLRVLNLLTARHPAKAHSEVTRSTSEVDDPHVSLRSFPQRKRCANETSQSVSCNPYAGCAATPSHVTHAWLADNAAPNPSGRSSAALHRVKKGPYGPGHPSRAS